MRGRKPKPTVLKLIQGNPGKRRLNMNEPKPPPGNLDPPNWLDLEARKEWNRIVPQLADLGLYTALDQQSAGCLCQIVADLADAQHKIRKMGTKLVVNKGRIQLNPYVRIARNSMLLIHKFASEFGCTVSSRARISVPGFKDESEFDRFMTRKI